MPIVHNPADCRVPCHRLDRFINPGERVHVTEAEARDIVGSVLVVVPDPKPSEEPKPATAKREKAKRGGKRAEVTKAPARETR